MKKEFLVLILFIFTNNFIYIIIQLWNSIFLKGMIQMSTQTNDERAVNSRCKNRKINSKSLVNSSRYTDNNDVFTVTITDAFYELLVDFDNVLINSDQVKFSCSKEKIKIQNEHNNIIILKNNKTIKVLLEDQKIDFEDNQSKFQINVKKDYLVVSTSTAFKILVNNNRVSFSDNLSKLNNSNCFNSYSTTYPEIKDNKKLLISEQKNKTFLPYTATEIAEKLKSKKYNSVEQLIEEEYTVSNDYYRFPMIARFKEAYKLVRIKENGSIAKAIDLALELMVNFSLNPSIITACKNLEELNIYLDCLEENELNNFLCFDIIYEI